MEPLNALINVSKDILNYMLLIKLTELDLIPLEMMKIILKLNFSLMDLLKLLSLSMEISLLINQEFITMFLEVLLEDMLLKFSDGELKTEFLIGMLLTHGTKIGEMMDISELEEEITNVELKKLLLLDYLNSEATNDLFNSN